MRLTVEQDILFPFIPNDKVAAMKEEPIFQKYKIDAGNLTRGLVSCTGAQVSTQASHPLMTALRDCLSPCLYYDHSHLVCRAVSIIW